MTFLVLRTKPQEVIQLEITALWLFLCNKMKKLSTKKLSEEAKKLLNSLKQTAKNTPLSDLPLFQMYCPDILGELFDHGFLTRGLEERYDGTIKLEVVIDETNSTKKYYEKRVLPTIHRQPLFSKELSVLDKIIFVEIECLLQYHETIEYDNDYFANMFMVDILDVEKSLLHLHSLGYIEITNTEPLGLRTIK